MSGENPSGKKVYDLEERTAKFGEAIVLFAKSIPAGPVTFPLISQLVRSGTSVGANYCEADESGSKKDFRHRISICKKEARETKHWFRMIAAAAPELKPGAVPLWKEARELSLIFAAVFRNSRC
jgi:four helix bundle protein